MAAYVGNLLITRHAGAGDGKREQCQTGMAIYESAATQQESDAAPGSPGTSAVREQSLREVWGRGGVGSSLDYQLFDAEAAEGQSAFLLSASCRPGEAGLLAWGNSGVSD
jgi:hypothetical protein